MGEAGWETGGAASAIGRFWRILLAEGTGLVEGAMSKRTIVIGLVVCLVLGGAAAGYLGYRLYMRNHPALAKYAMEFPEGTAFEDGMLQIEKVFEADEALRKVIQEHDLVARLKVGSEDEAVALMRERFIVHAGAEPGHVHVLFLDRKYDLSREVLEALHQEFIRTREARAVLRPLGL